MSLTVIPAISSAPTVLAADTGIGSYESHTEDGNLMTFQSGDEELQVELCTDRMARIQLSVDGSYRGEDELYYMVQKNEWPAVSKTVSDEGGYIKIATDEMVIRVQKSPLRVQMYEKDNLTLISKDTDDTGMYYNRDTGVRGVRKVEGPGGGGIFGFGTGEKGHTEQLNKYDKDITDFAMDHGQLIAPFYMSTVGYGIFLNTLDQNTKFFKRGGGFETRDYLDYFFIYGPDFKTILNEYAELTGRMELYGKWAHGFMLSKYGNDNATQDEFIEWIERLRNEDYPCDSYVFDYGWRGDKWSPHRWDTTRFPDLESMFQRADELGFKVGLHNNKGTPEAKENESDPTNKGGRFWIPEVREKWVNAHMDNVIKPGYGDWFWPDEFDIAEGNTHYNYMPTLSAKYVYEAWQAYTDQSRPMFITRGSYAGQHFATAWSGDIQNTVSEMGYQIGYSLDAGLVGYWSVSNDLGGFMKRPSNNLYTRWVSEFGAWSSMMRTHGHDGREPWTFDQTAQDTLRQNLKIRYSLYPYTYSLAYQGYSAGVPMMRPMLLEDNNQNNPDAWDLDRQYYYGDWFLVAPALSETDTSVKVWLPANTTWYNYYTGGRYEGGEEGRTMQVSAKLDEIPVYVKAGAIVPMGPDVDYADEKPLDPLTLDIYPKGHTSFTLFEDDGETREYITQDAYATTTFESMQDGSDISFKINERACPNPDVYQPVERSYNLKFNHIETLRGATVNGTLVAPVDTLDAYNAAEQACYLDTENSVVYVKTPDTGKEILVTIDTDGIVEPDLGAEEDIRVTEINPGDLFEMEEAELIPNDFNHVRVATDHAGYTGSGFVAGYKQVGDTAQFNVDIKKGGNYDLVLRCGSGKKNTAGHPEYDNSPRQGALYVNGQKVKDINIPVKDSWKEWFEYAIEDVKLSTGVNQIKVVSEGSVNPGNFNLDSMRFDYILNTVSAYGRIEAESASERNGIDIKKGCSDGGDALNHIENGDWAKFSDVDFGEGGLTGFEARYAAGLQGGTLEVWVDSMADQRAVELKLEPTGDWNTWKTASTSELQNITGIHDIYIKFVNEETTSSICDFNWFRFIAPEIVVHDASKRIEAETADVREGIDIKKNSGDDSTGALNHIENGDWAMFQYVDFGAGTLDGVQVRYAAGLQGGTLELRLDTPDGQKIADVALDPTGSWNTWKTVKAACEKVTGVHKLYLSFVGEGAGSICDMNWLQFVVRDPDAFTKIEAETAKERSGIDLISKNSDDGTGALNHIENGDWARFANIDFDAKTANGIEMRYTAGLQGGTAEIYLDSLDGQKIATVPITSTGAWTVWNTAKAACEAVTGVHDVYIKFVNETTTKSICDLNWIRFADDYVQPVIEPDDEALNLEDGILYGLSAETTVSELSGMLKAVPNAEFAVLNASGEKLADDAFAGTGCTLQLLVGGAVVDEAVLCVLGDVTSDGVLGVGDLLSIKADILGKAPLDGVYKTAADYDGNGKVNVLDLLKVKLAILGA